MVGCKMEGPARDRVMQLMEEKDRIECEIGDHTAILESNNVGMHDSLVDDEGFPRNDIDVYKVRQARHRIICLENDHKEVMKKIEDGLAEVHSDFLGLNHGTAASASYKPNTSSSNGHSSGVANNGASETGFAVVGSVQIGSPADNDGLCEGDEILQFGSINSQNFCDVNQIYQVVSHSLNQAIRVQLRRNETTISTHVTPRAWAMPGLLGCHIRKLDT
ncbi:hypothetical protein ACJJTC_015933 [Scirpophaga incertulas]